MTAWDLTCRVVGFILARLILAGWAVQRWHKAVQHG